MNVPICLEECLLLVYHCVYHVNGNIVDRGFLCLDLFACVSLCVSSKGVGRLCCRQRYVVGGESTDISAGPGRFPQLMTPKFVSVIYSEPDEATQPASLMWAIGMLKDMNTNMDTHIQPPKKGRNSNTITKVRRYACTNRKTP